MSQGKFTGHTQTRFTVQKSLYLIYLSSVKKYNDHHISHHEHIIELSKASKGRVKSKRALAIAKNN